MFKRLLAVVRKIPRGKVCSYGAVARLAGHPGAARQVVWALHSGSAKGLPWHRVVGAGGRIRLAGESGLEQRFRLEAEGVSFRGNRVDMTKHEWRSATPTTLGRRRRAAQKPTAESRKLRAQKQRTKSHR